MKTKKEIKVLATCRLWLRKNADKHSTAILWEAVRELYEEQPPFEPDKIKGRPVTVTGLPLIEK